MTSLANVFNSDSVGSGGPGPTTSTWEDVLTNGNTSGVNSAIISTGQTLKFIDGINISGGNTSNVTGTPAISSVLIGGGVTGSSTECTVIGKSANAGANQGSTLVGNTASCTGGGAVSVGWNSSAALGGTALGWLAQATGNNSVSLGVNSSTGLFANAVAIGSGVVASAASQIQLGDAAFTTNIRGALTMGTGVATNTTLAGILTVGNCAGVPTGAAANGSLIYNSTGSALYAKVGGTWNVVQTSAPATPTIASVLTAGNTTNAGQALIFTSGVTIGSAAVAPSTGTPAVNSVLIGGGTTGSGGNCVVIGRSATTSTFGFCTAVGSAATVTAANGTAIGYNATAAGTATAVGYLSVANASNSTAVGSSANVGTFVDCTSLGKGAVCSGPQSIAVGSSTNTNTSTAATILGTFATMGTVCDNSILVGTSATIGNGTTDAIVIGKSATLGAGANGSILIGTSASLSASSANNTLIGIGITNSTATSVNNSAVGANISFTAGASSTNTIALGAGTVVPPGSADSVFFTSNFASTTSASGTAVSIDANGRFHANTSSIRYKQDVKPLRDPERILQIRCVDYAMKNSEEYGMSCGCPAYILDEAGNSVKNDCDGLKCGVRDVGMIAEEIANADLSEFVVFGPDPNDPTKRQCRSIKYDRLTGPIIECLKIQKYRMEFLDDENKSLLDKITTLEVANTAMKSKLDWLESKVIMAGL